MTRPSIVIDTHTRERNELLGMESDLAETLLQAPKYLQAAINDFIKEHDEEPKPFI